MDIAMTHFAPISQTHVHLKADFTASDLKRAGAVLEAASDGKVVRITAGTPDFCSSEKITFWR